MNNWAGNYTYGAKTLHEPATVAELQEVVAKSARVKALGSRHSFNAIADTDGNHVSTRKLNRVLNLDAVAQTITVEGGMLYGHLSRFLHEAGFALPNLASLPHISVAGTIATATHGSGVKNGNLATHVSALGIVTADGEVVRLSRSENPERFPGAVASLGALGVVADLTLDILPTFDVAQTVFENLPVAELAKNFDAILSAAYSVSLFTDWRTDSIRQVWVKETAPFARRFERNFFGATPAHSEASPIPNGPPENCTPQLGVPGHWHERLPHFKLEFTPSNGEELQSEYFVPRADAWAAFEAVDRLREQIAPLVYITEIRSVAKDDLWLSPAYEQDVVAFHFTWHQEWEQVRLLLPLIDKALAPFSPRPHWGKLFTLPPEDIKKRYPRWGDFESLRQDVDPSGKFQNAYLEHLFG